MHFPDDRNRVLATKQQPCRCVGATSCCELPGGRTGFNYTNVLPRKSAISRSSPCKSGEGVGGGEGGGEGERASVMEKMRRTAVCNDV